MTALPLKVIVLLVQVSVICPQSLVHSFLFFFFKRGADVALG